jgi:hypothetical protein
MSMFCFAIDLFLIRFSYFADSDHFHPGQRMSEMVTLLINRNTSRLMRLLVLWMLKADCVLLMNGTLIQRQDNHVCD